MPHCQFRTPKYKAYEQQRLYEGSRSVNPLSALENALPQNGKHYVVISCGGNDFRENLANPFRLIRDISQVQARYLEIVRTVKELSNEHRTIHPILMFQYRTDANMDPYRIYTVFRAIGIVVFVINVLAIGLLVTPFIKVAAGTLTLRASMIACSVFGFLGLYLSHKIAPFSVLKDVLMLRNPSHAVFRAMLKRFYAPILAEARKSQYPVLDLPNTFDPHKHLYTCGIEPNAKGSKLIAEGLVHILKNHNFDGDSLLYAKIGETYTSSLNTPNWLVAYPGTV